VRSAASADAPPGRRRSARHGNAKRKLARGRGAALEGRERPHIRLAPSGIRRSMKLYSMSDTAEDRSTVTAIAASH